MKQLRHITSALILSLAIATQAQSVLQVRDTITDPNFVFPESYEADTHKMLQNWYLQNYTVIDREINTTDDIATTDDEYIARLDALPTTIETPFNSLVKGCIEMYTQRRRTLVERMLGMSLYYMPIFEQALEQEGVPLELKYLPIIESALDPNAVSPAGATGLWQFMLPTARGLGLEINTLVDERRDPHKSSEAAARYLKQLYDIYNDWSLAIAAYNCGPGNVNKAMRRAGEGKKDFWEIYPYLPRETRGYVPAFISAVYAMNYYDRHNISPTLARRPIITDTIRVCKRVHFQQIADVLNIPIDEIRILNPQYRQDIIPGDQHPYALTLPHYQTLCYIVSEDSIVAHNAHLYTRRSVVEPSTGASRISDDGNYIITEEIKYHKVRKGDTFAKIARRYGVTVASIKRANNIRTLRAGRTIKIITTKRTPRPVEPDSIQANDSITIVEDVITTTAESPFEEMPDTEGTSTADDENQTDDTDDTTAPTDDTTGDNGTDTATEASAEQAAASRVAQQVQSTFNRPTQSGSVNDNTSQQTQQRPTYYRIRKGDTLYKIAQKYGTSIDRISQLNPGLNPSKIQIGKRIRVK